MFTMLLNVFYKKLYSENLRIKYIKLYFLIIAFCSFFVFDGLTIFPMSQAVAQTLGGSGGGSNGGGCAEVSGAGGGPGLPGEAATMATSANCGGGGGGGGGAGNGASGAGGSTVLPDNGFGGAGGVGGAHGLIISDPTYTNQTTLTGIDGTRGGDGTNSTLAGSNSAGGGGAGGGAGGYGLVVNQMATIVNNGNGIILGGDGGIGGAGGDAKSRARGGIGGNGGDGGIGIFLNAITSSISNTGNVRGGSGGAAGLAGKSPNTSAGPDTYYDAGGDPGAGGAGIYVAEDITGTSLTNTATGQIHGGDGGASISQAGAFATFINANGGDGGDGVFGVLTVDNQGTIGGGAGTAAGVGSAYFSASDPGLPSYFIGANGGNGGNGIVQNSGGGTINISGTVTGGQGAAGGAVTASYSTMSGNGGSGGSGGSGIIVTTGTTVNNSGTINGGDGGNGAIATNTGDTNGNGGAGGFGISGTGTGVTIINSGMIRAGSAGAAGSGTAGIGGIAINMIDGANTLELRKGFDIQGISIAQGAGNVFVLGGDDDNTEIDPAFSDVVSSTTGGADPYQGFQTLQKKGTSTWSLLATYGSWQIRDGTLQIGNGSTVGALLDTATIDTGSGEDSGYLAYNRSDDIVFGGTITGTGGVRQNGGGKLTLTGTNDYSGDTAMAAGTLSVASESAIGTGVLSFSGGFLQITGTTYVSTAKNVSVSGQDTGFDITDATNIFVVSRAIAGTGALTKKGPGMLVLSAQNSYSGGTSIEAGELQLGDATADGSIIGDVTISQQSSLIVSNAGATFLQGNISGDGGVVQHGYGTLTLSGDNTYTDGTDIYFGIVSVQQEENLGELTGDLNFEGGTLQITGIDFNNTSRTIAWGAPGGGFDIADANNTFTISTVFTGAGQLDKLGAGILALTGDSSGYTGTTNVQGGTLRLDDANLGGAVNVQAGGALGGHGTIEGAVDVADGGQLFGQSGQMANFMDGLTLSAGSRVDVTLNNGPSDDALFNVLGDLALNGFLDVNNSSTVTLGVYRIFNYSGNLTQNTMAIGSMPGNAEDFYLQTAMSNQVNLVNTQGREFFYWDGSSPGNDGRVDGGTGTWDATNDNWTDQTGMLNSGWKTNAFAVFGGDAGIVTVAPNHTPIASGMQFMVDGYILQGSVINLEGDGDQRILVGNGDPGSVSMNATISSELHGAEGLTKSGYGTLILTGANTYTGSTTVEEGTLELADGGTIDKSSQIVLTNTQFDQGNFAISHSDTYTLDNVISGIGDVFQRGTGTTIFAGDNDFSGGLTVESGIADHAFGSGTLKIKAGARASLDTFNTTVGSLVAYDPNGATVDGDITLGSGTLTLNQTMHGDFSGVISGQGGLALSDTSNSTLMFLGANTYTGATTINGGLLVQGAQGAFSSASGYNVGTAGTMQLGGFSTGIATLANHGTVAFGGAGGTTLTVAGNYSGDSGTLLINAVLAGDGSITDMLKVEGDTSGNTTIVVTNRNGIGEQTINGIKIIDIAGKSAGTFSLQGDYTTKDGQQAIITNSAYAYTLHKNSKAGLHDGDWYLVSQNTEANPDDPTDPRYSAAAPVYESYAATLQALNKLPTLQQRVGDLYNNDTGDVAPGKSGEAARNTIWGRIEGAHNRLKSDSTAGNLHQNINTYIIQAGVDGQFYEDENGKLIAQIFGQYGNAHSSVTNNTGDGGGDITTQGWGLGSALTWRGIAGFYIDGQAQANWYNSDLSVDAASPTLRNDNNGFGYALSIEAGQRFIVNDQWSLTPQAQLMWSAVDFDNFTDSYNANISNRDGNSLSARIGLAANYANHWKGEDGLWVHTNIYGILNLYQEFLGGTKTSYSGTNLSTDNDASWSSIGAGGTYSWANNKYAIYGAGSVNTSLNHFANSYILKGSVGFKVNW